jgi:hypothetical protein
MSPNVLSCSIQRARQHSYFEGKKLLRPHRQSEFLLGLAIPADLGHARLREPQVLDTPAPVQIHVAWLAAGASIAAALLSLIGAVISNRRSRLRDLQDKESEWRSHAIELTKLDAQRIIEIRKYDSTTELRPVVLTFLANYRDLQELNTDSPKDLYNRIRENRIIQRRKPTYVPPGVVSCHGDSADHPKVYLPVILDKATYCAYCSAMFVGRMQSWSLS